MNIHSVCLVLLLSCCNFASCPDPDSAGSGGFFDSLKYFASEFGRIVSHVVAAFNASIEEECEFKCPNGAKPRPNPDYVPVSNGCGVPGVLKLPKAPDYVPTKELDKCCDNHDICYGTCNKDKDKCDYKFKKCLYNICSTVRKFTGENDALNTGCKGVARAFYMGVVGVGCKYYLDSQKDACLCWLNYYDEF